MGHSENRDDSELQMHRLPVEKRQRDLVIIDCIVERDKLDAPIIAAPVEVRDPHVHFERARYRRHLHMICNPQTSCFQSPEKRVI